ncbi:hypothetical protein [Polymorphospora sp. NPDC050346]|uniref:hypothetical protein n=1 Tax=Polymorphospora sp. NPDC050346 TaxID=3155780 RepID=UPI0033E3D088
MAQHRDTRLARIRAAYTGERHTEALAGVREHGRLHGPVPEAVDAEQELLEARIGWLLAAAFGDHRPADVGGPCGIASVTPEPDRLILRPSPAGLAPVVTALLLWTGDDGLHGRLGLQADLDPAGRRLTVRHPHLDAEVLITPDPQPGEGTDDTADRMRAAVGALDGEPEFFGPARHLVFDAGLPVEVDAQTRARAGDWSTSLRRLGLLADRPAVDLTTGPPPAGEVTGPDPAALVPDRPRRPDPTGRRYQLSPDLEALLDGRGLRGEFNPDLWTWLYEVRRPVDTCGWCGERIDARTEDTTVQMVMGAYDPDLSPVVRMLSCTLAHPGCRPSGVQWARADRIEPVDQLTLPSAGGTVEYRWVVRPVVLDDPDSDPADGTADAALVLIGQVTDAQGQSARACQGLLTEHLLDQGLTRVDDILGADGWTVRIVAGPDRPRIVVRHPADPTTGHRRILWYGRTEPSPQWLDLARTRHRVLLVAGPDLLDPTDRWLLTGPSDPDDRVDAVHEALDDLMHDGVLLTVTAGVSPA